VRQLAVKKAPDAAVIPVFEKFAAAPQPRTSTCIIGTGSSKELELTLPTTAIFSSLVQPILSEVRHDIFQLRHIEKLTLVGNNPEILAEALPRVTCLQAVQKMAIVVKPVHHNEQHFACLHNTLQGMVRRMDRRRPEWAPLPLSVEELEISFESVRFSGYGGELEALQNLYAILPRGLRSLTLSFRKMSLGITTWKDTQWDAITELLVKIADPDNAPQRLKNLHVDLRGNAIPWHWIAGTVAREEEAPLAFDNPNDRYGWKQWRRGHDARQQKAQEVGTERSELLGGSDGGDGPEPLLERMLVATTSEYMESLTITVSIPRGAAGKDSLRSMNAYFREHFGERFTPKEGVKGEEFLIR